MGLALFAVRAWALHIVTRFYLALGERETALELAHGDGLALGKLLVIAATAVRANTHAYMHESGRHGSAPGSRRLAQTSSQKLAVAL